MPDYLNTFIISVIGGIASGITGLVGLAYSQRYTENRKLVDGTLRELELLADQCAKSAGVAWSSIGDPDAEAPIETICLLHDISSFTTFVKDRVTNAGVRIDSAHINFRRVTTGDNFDVKGRLPDPGRVSEIRSSAAALKMACRSVIYDRNKLGLW